MPLLLVRLKNPIKYKKKVKICYYSSEIKLWTSVAMWFSSAFLFFTLSVAQPYMHLSMTPTVSSWYPEEQCVIYEVCLVGFLKIRLVKDISIANNTV